MINKKNVFFILGNYFLCQYNNDDIDECDSISSSSYSYSDYESDSDSIISVDNENDQENPIKYNLRVPNLKPDYKALPKQYKNESVTEFVKNIHALLKKSTSLTSCGKLNYYSSDDN